MHCTVFDQQNNNNMFVKLVSQANQKAFEKSQLTKSSVEKCMKLTTKASEIFSKLLKSE